MRTASILSPALLACALTAASAAEPLVVAGEPLEPASCGVRDTLWVNHYRAVLHLPRDAPIQAVRDPAVPKAVVIRIVDARYLPERIPGKWRRALRTQLADAPMRRIAAAYDGLRSGDVVSFVHVPGSGTAMRVNGVEIHRTGGHGVIDAILEAWAGPETVAAKLRGLAREHPCAGARPAS